jgi:DNA-binding Lrp family transcriptional regulator
MANLADVRFKKSEHASSREFAFDTNMLKLFMAVDGQKTVREVSQEVGLRQPVFKDTFIKLLKLGLIEQIGTEEACVDPSFIDALRKTLIQLVGPLGEVLMIDSAQDLGWKMDHIPMSGLAEFVSAVAREIPSDKQSNEFKRRMLKEMQALGV